ncbi:uncharacterized, partial [Tachysurus ichikawai]
STPSSSPLKGPGHILPLLLVCFPYSSSCILPQLGPEIKSQTSTICFPE